MSAVEAIRCLMQQLAWLRSLPDPRPMQSRLADAIEFALTLAEEACPTEFDIAAEKFQRARAQ